MPGPISVANVQKLPGAGQFGEDVYDIAAQNAHIYYSHTLYSYTDPGTLSFRCIMQPGGNEGYFLAGPSMEIMWFTDPNERLYGLFSGWQFYGDFPAHFDRSAWLMLTLTWDTDGRAAFVVDNHIVASTENLTLLQTQDDSPFSIGSASGSWLNYPRCTHVSDLLWLREYTEPTVIKMWYDEPRDTYPNALLQWGEPPPRTAKHFRFIGGF